MTEEQFFILYAGLIPSDSAFLMKMADKYKDVIKANKERHENVKEVKVTSVNDLKQFFGRRK